MKCSFTLAVKAGCPEFLLSDAIKDIVNIRAEGLRGPELPGTVEGAETALEG